MTNMNTVALHRPTAAIKPPENATWPLADVLALFDLPFTELM
ncbi:biotin synthase BioB, partial [Escherichia coli]|nr:biotin synthase BioB [Escherichia coli]